MARLRLRRLLGPKLPIPGRLHVCPACGGDFVTPAGRDFEEGAGRWIIALRCGACGHRGEALVAASDVRELRRVLDRQASQIAAAAEQLAREEMTAWIASFSVALERDLIDAGDFE